jgi:hypothetical protein
MIKDGAAAQQDFTTRTVGEQEYPRSVCEEVQLRTVESPPPWLRVVQ